MTEQPENFDPRAVLCANELTRKLLPYLVDLMNDSLPRYFPEVLSGDESPDMVDRLNRQTMRTITEYVDAWYRGNRTTTPTLTWHDSSGDNATCTCGNTPDSDGFHPCDVRGNEVQPTRAEWPLPLIICGRCRAIYLQNVDAMGAGAAIAGVYA